MSTSKDILEMEGDELDAELQRHLDAVSIGDSDSDSESEFSRFEFAPRIAWSSAKLEKLFNQHNKEVNENKNVNANRDDLQAERDERLSTLSKQLRVANVLPSEYENYSISDTHRKADYFFTTPDSPAEKNNSDCNESNRTVSDSDDTALNGNKAVLSVHGNARPLLTTRNTETTDVEPSQPSQDFTTTPGLQKSDKMASLNIGDPWIELMECMKNSEKTINRYQKNLENVNNLSAVAITTLFKSRAEITSTVKRTKRRLQRAQAAWDKQKRANAAAAVAAVAAAVAASTEEEDQEGGQPSDTPEQADANHKSDAQRTDKEDGADTRSNIPKNLDTQVDAKTKTNSAIAQVGAETNGDAGKQSDADTTTEGGASVSTSAEAEKATDAPTNSDGPSGTDILAGAGASAALVARATADAENDSDDDAGGSPLTQAEQLAEFKKQQHERLVALGLVSIDEEECVQHPEGEGEGDAASQRLAQERADRRVLKEMAEKQARMAEENARLEVERERARLAREATIKREAEERAREIEERHRQQEEERRRWQEEARAERERFEAHMKAVEAERAQARAEREAEIKEAMRVEEENWRRWEEERLRKEAEQLLAAQTAAVAVLVRRMRLHMFRCRRHRAVSVLQRMARHWLTRRRLRAAIAQRQLERHNKRMAMATTVQRMYRGWQGRKVAHALWQERQERRIRRVTPLLQRVVRGFLSRRLTVRSLKRARSNVIFLQRVVRGHLARKHFQHERERVLAEQARRKAAEAKRAAISLQRVQRGHRGRALAAIRREEVARALHARRSDASVRVQSWFRARRLRTRTHATMLLQRVVRGRLGRKIVQRERRRRHAASEMQRLVRGHQGRARAALEIEVQRQEEERRVQERAEAERRAAIEAAQAAEAIELELELQHQVERGGRHVDTHEHELSTGEQEQAATAEGLPASEAAPRVANRVTALRRLVEANRREGSAATLLQRTFRGARIRKAFRRAMGGVGYVDDDDYNYGEVDVDSFLDLKGGLDGLLGDDLLEYHSADDDGETEEETSDDEGGDDGHTSVSNDSKTSVQSIRSRDHSRRYDNSNIDASHDDTHAGDSRAPYNYSTIQQPRRPVGKHRFNILPSKHEAGAATATSDSNPPKRHPKRSKQEQIDSIADQWGFKDKRTAMLMLKRRRKFEKGKKKQKRRTKKKVKVRTRDRAKATTTQSDPNGPLSRHGDPTTSAMLASRPPVHAWSSEPMAADEERPEPHSGSLAHRPPFAGSFARNARPSSRERQKLSYSSGPQSSTRLPPILAARRIKSSGSISYSSKR